MRRWTIALVVVIVVAGSFYMEWRRPRVTFARPENTSTDVQAAENTQFPNLNDPEEFARYVELLRSNYQAMHARYLQLRHRERITEEEIGPAGEILATHETLEIVWFENGVEQRQRADDPQQSEGVIPTSPPISRTIYPFYAEDQPGFYEYQFEGFEEWSDVVVARIAFVPNPPFDRKMQGWVWADARTGMPLRFDGRLAKPPALVDDFRMTASYGSSENGAHQLRQMTTEGAGGFAFVRKRFRKDFQFFDYQPSAP